MFIIPVFLNSEEPTCPKCGANEEIVETCAKCGHIYEENGGGKAPIVLKIIMYLLITFLILFLFMMVDVLSLNGRIGNSLFMPSDCEYKIPDGWNLLVKDGYYVVHNTDAIYKHRFLSGHFYFDEDLWHDDVIEPFYYPDSCTAKAALKEYLSPKYLLP